MPFISSAELSSRATPPDLQKRKYGEQSQPSEPKRQKIMGGFLDDDDDDDHDGLEAFNEAQYQSEFEIQEQRVDLPQISQSGSRAEPKRPKIMGGFLDNDDDDDDGLEAFNDAHLESQIDTQEQPVKLTEVSRSQSTLESVVINSVTERSTIVPAYAPPNISPTSVKIKTCNGKALNVPLKKPSARVSYERLIASRSTTAPGRAQKSYYGIDIHSLLNESAKEVKAAEAPKPAPVADVRPSIEAPIGDKRSKKLSTAMWTEKYRARKYTELIGDERTNRSILRWLRGWDPIVYPSLARAKQNKKYNNDEEERPHRKVLLLCGPPGLGKTTLAHVCARQAGYEVLEINASDERSRDVVKGRIRDALGTENVKGMNVELGEQKVRKVGRPVCVVVDEVDGVVSGSGGSGEGGFMKALTDLVLLDQRNSARTSERASDGRKRKGDNFRFLRPLILVCNDVYHASLRPLRQSSVAEIIHVRQAPLENVVSRMKSIFTLEGIPSDSDGVRRLCEASWGLAKRKQRGVRSTGAAEGDIRSVLVAAEWVAHKLRNESSAPLRLTRNWLEQRVLADAGGGSFFKGMNRGGVRDIVDRVFTEGAGFPDVPLGDESLQDPYDRSEAVSVDVANIKKRHAIRRLCEMVDASGDHDRCTSECFSSYPLQPYQDDTFLTKPNAAYDWLHFHDTISSRIYSAHDWELGAYLSQATSAFHLLFATAQGKAQQQYREIDEEEEEAHPFSGPRADYAAFEATKQNQAILSTFQSSFSAPLLRLFRSSNNVATELIPNVIRMLSPDIKPVVVRGSEQKSVASVRKESERALVQSAVRVMTGLGVTFEKVRIENEGGGHGGWAYRMEPPLDALVSFSKVPGFSSATNPVRYAVRQVLDQEYRKESIRKNSENLSSTGSKKSTTKSDDIETPANPAEAAKLKYGTAVKRDFFGRIIQDRVPSPQEDMEQALSRKAKSAQQELSSAGRKVWVTYHDGFSNAVRKPISMAELLSGL
ncbi:protein ctf18 [Aspergillus nidulans FGSC A4]|uniref:Chromosome transmission fidelity protein 18 n=1 Tax=Emericella nidulans (strain FGSC A4 / ATCC 38163 / CBS 112.46 / NRRL 194 / M139) TaxID=227321 RepID=CTF18_EMENI|nr:protein ctf18 [Aspergillus nidulans FGSC A4]P0C1D3.1 RecName: Full=Chromosome transmission fidelity protein 18 [Aspergillus nidulans FGSC A4]CBF71262.1 TPA: Chromosome transmission fidelity protein 18 [Source:UniProtKB/Swiss-Prot;Acc:P0C1D3] [Aspergillus nidulans FGSC A4]